MKTTLASSLFITVVVAGCTYEHERCVGEACEETAAAVTQPAFAVGGFVPWPLTNGQLRLCITQKRSAEAPLSPTEFTAVRDHVVSILNSTWGVVPGLDFVASCTAPAMRIALVRGAGWGFCGLGNGAACTVAADPANLSSVDGTAVHEVGHGLGLLHEHQRPDAEPLCPVEQTILNGCTQCATGTCSASDANDCWFSLPEASTISLSPSDQSQAATLLAGGNAACSACAQGTCQVGSCDSQSNCAPATSYWACLGVNPTSGTMKVSTADLGSARARVGDRTPIPNGIVLTKQYDGRSIMNYCASVNGRTDAFPTSGDLLGMEMLYAADRNYGLGCGVGCFLTSAGLVASSAGSITSEWIMRGSVGIPFRVSETSNDVFSYPVSALPNGTSTVRYSFVDVAHHARTGSGTVIKSDTSFAAIAGAIAAVD